MLAFSLAPMPRTVRRVWSAFPGSIVTPAHATVLQDTIVVAISGRMAIAGQVAALATPAAWVTAEWWAALARRRALNCWQGRPVSV